MWRTGGAGEIYVYVDQSKQDTSICKVKPSSVCNSNYGTSIGRGAFTFLKGKWNQIQQVVTLNTVSPDGKVVNMDGAIRIYVNGIKVIEYKQLVWRTMDRVRMEGLQWDTFFGGSSDDFSTPLTVYAFFRRVRLSWQ
jgi:hypothetical protein